GRHRRDRPGAPLQATGRPYRSSTVDSGFGWVAGVAVRRCHNVACMRVRHGGPVLEAARLQRRVLWGRRLRVLGALWFGVAVALALAAGTAVAAAAPGAGSTAAH